MSIVIYDLDINELIACLESLLAALEHSSENDLLDEYSVILVDNGNNRAALSPLIKHCVTYDSAGENVGYGAGHNRAINASNAKYHLVLNPDVVVETDTISQFIRLAEASSDICLIGPKGLTKNSEDARLPKRYPALLDLFLRGFAPGFIRNKFDARLGRYEYRELATRDVVDVELISGCCMFFKTEVARQIGAFDEKYFLYFEDFDLSLRMKAHGRVIYAPAINIVHYGGNSARKGIRHISMFSRAAIRFYSVHGWKLV